MLSAQTKPQNVVRFAHKKHTELKIPKAGNREGGRKVKAAKDRPAKTVLHIKDRVLLDGK